jgi:hypothetical protein
MQASKLAGPDGPSARATCCARPCTPSFIRDQSFDGTNEHVRYLVPCTGTVPGALYCTPPTIEWSSREITPLCSVSLPYIVVVRTRTGTGTGG